MIKLSKITIFLVYIISNIIFYNSVFVNETNFNLLKITTFLGITEILFWIIFLNDLLKSEKLNIKKVEIKKVEILFWVVISGIAMSRILLTSSPYFNDFLNTEINLIRIVGSFRILYIFISILGIVLASSTQKIISIFITILNFIVSILVWVDFDSNISSILRIIIGILGIISVVLIKKYKIIEKNENEEEKEQNDEN